MSNPAQAITAAALCTLFLFLAVCLCFAGELIPPSRTLQNAKEPYGKLSVVSEPPGLKVFFDGTALGQTPIWLEEVRSGPHRLRIERSETEIFVQPGKILQISFFKGSFTARLEESEKKPKLEKKLSPGRDAVVPDPGVCKYGYYEHPPGIYHCYYGGWGTHMCHTYNGLSECKVRGEKAYSCEQLQAVLRAKDCCQEKFGGFTRTFSLGYCGID